jgi:ribonuclease P protein component
LFKEGKSFAAFPFRVYYLHQAKTLTAHSSPFVIQVGVGASSKNFKKAVDRNRIKRLMRESYRLQKQSLYDLTKEKKIQLAVFFIYTGKELPEHKMVNEKIGLILQRLINIMNENNLADT